MAEQRPKAPLGKILLRRKAVTPEALDKALEAQKLDRRPLASALIEDGIVSEAEALKALSEQHGVPGIDLSQVAVATVDLDLVPREVAEAQRILPVLVRDDKLFLAMVDPADRRVIDELEFVTGRRVFPVRRPREGARAHDRRRLRSQGRGRGLLPRPSRPQGHAREPGHPVPARSLAAAAAPVAERSADAGGAGPRDAGDALRAAHLPGRGRRLPRRRRLREARARPAQTDGRVRQRRPRGAVPRRAPARGAPRALERRLQADPRRGRRERDPRTGQAHPRGPRAPRHRGRPRPPRAPPREGAEPTASTSRDGSRRASATRVSRSS